MIECINVYFTGLGLRNTDLDLVCVNVVELLVTNL
jgi:hypothetical protein